MIIDNVMSLIKDKNDLDIFKILPVDALKKCIKYSSNMKHVSLNVKPILPMFNNKGIHLLPNKSSSLHRRGDNVTFADNNDSTDSNNNLPEHKGTHVHNILVMDNCSSHVQHIVTMYIATTDSLIIALPPNTSYMCQILDRGIIHPFKALLRRFCIKCCNAIKSIPNNDVIFFEKNQHNDLHTIVMALYGWNDMKETSLSNTSHRSVCNMVKATLDVCPLRPFKREKIVDRKKDTTYRILTGYEDFMNKGDGLWNLGQPAFDNAENPVITVASEGNKAQKSQNRKRKIRT